MAYDQGTIQQIYDWIPASGIQKGWKAPNSVTVGGPDDKELTVIQDYKNIFGRPPTVSELQAALPAAQAGQGGAFISQIYQNQQNDPAQIYARQQTQWQQAAPEHYDAVNQLTQSLLGRQATQDELSHYGTLLASGQADPYQLSQFLQSLPEYQNVQDMRFRQGLDTQLQQSDQAFFERVSPQISQQYALMGRPTSPALAVAMTDLAAQLSNNRQNYLAQLSASQYGGNKAAALGNYGQTQQGVQDRLSQNANAQYQNYQNMWGRANQAADYQTQRNDWMDAMSRYAPHPGTLDYLNTVFQGVNAAANVGKTVAAFGA